MARVHRSRAPTRGCAQSAPTPLLRVGRARTACAPHPRRDRTRPTPRGLDLVRLTALLAGCAARSLRACALRAPSPDLDLRQRQRTVRTRHASAAARGGRQQCPSALHRARTTAPRRPPLAISSPPHSCRVMAQRAGRTIRATRPSGKSLRPVVRGATTRRPPRKWRSTFWSTTRARRHRASRLPSRHRTATRRARRSPLSTPSCARATRSRAHIRWARPSSKISTTRREPGPRARGANMRVQCAQRDDRTSRARACRYARCTAAALPDGHGRPGTRQQPARRRLRRSLSVIRRSFYSTACQSTVGKIPAALEYLD